MNLKTYNWNNGTLSSPIVLTNDQIKKLIAIGQREDGIVLFLVINGRLANSIGADMIDLTDIMENYGAVNAANLDGGSSSELVINNNIINTPVAGGKDGLRNMSTFWVVK